MKSRVSSETFNRRVDPKATDVQAAILRDFVV